MPNKTVDVRQSKSSNEESFEALNDTNSRGEEEEQSRPSNSSDFDSINDRKSQDQEVQEAYRQRKSHVEKELENLQKVIKNSEKSIEEQFQILTMEYHEREKEVSLLKAQNTHLKRQLQELEQKLKFERQELQKKKIQQLNNVSGSLKKAQFTLSPEKNFSKKNTTKIQTSFDEYLNEKLKESEFKINSLQSKIQFFSEEDLKVREFLSKTLKFNPNFPMELSTLVQSAVIQLDSNLKEVNREIENIILSAHLGNSNKISARRENQHQEKYNHWQVLSNLDIIKEYVKEHYKGK